MAKWCQCSDSTLYPDGGMRCNLDGRLALSPCERQDFGKPAIYKFMPKNAETKQKPMAKIKTTTVKKTKLTQGRLSL